MATNYRNSYLRGINESPEEFPYDPEDYRHETAPLTDFIEPGTIIELHDDYAKRQYTVVSILGHEGKDFISDHYYPMSYGCIMCNIDVNPFEKLRESDKMYHNSMVYVDGEILHLFKNNPDKTVIIGMCKFKKPNEQLTIF